MKKKIFKTLWLLSAATPLITVISCDNKLDFNSDGVNKNKQEPPLNPETPTKPVVPNVPKPPVVPEQPKPPVIPVEPDKPNTPTVNNDLTYGPLLQKYPTSGSTQPHFNEKGELVFPDLSTNYFKEKRPVIETGKKENKTLYNEIYNRTFAISFITNDIDETGNKNELSLVNGLNEGTGWLFDYYKYKNSTSKYKLFIATNFHVGSAIKNSLSNNKTELFDYADELLSNKGEKASTIGINIGRSSLNNNNFSKQDNMASFNNFSGSAKFYTNYNGANNNSTYNPSLLNSPKVVFVAAGFMNDNDEKQYKNVLVEKAKNYKHSDEEIKNKVRNRANNASYYQDFMVFEIDVDLDKDTSSNKEFSNWINNAISTFDTIKSYAKANIIPNHDQGNIPYVSYDYASMFYSDSRRVPSIFKNYDKADHSANFGYIAGYPKDNYNQHFVWNNNSQRYDEKEINKWSINSRSFINGFTGTNINFKPDFWGKLYADHYGYRTNISFSSLYYGASGSMVTNEYGLPIGIYSGVPNVETNETSKNGVFTPLVQNFDIPIYGIDKAYFHAYNLIDGSDKRLYPYQKTSYRENLRFLYPNGFENNNESKNTAIFDKEY
ncbi:MIP family Ig-specific serine endopeptidase [Mycoplasma crocodyli]|uniref:MIP family Ig-specific serine endopeptidase n=1 Tax=Mycoplasma crocodyli TaxID=50052 RepID=UPI00031048F4|nr:DUF31 family protein [Mycoplasma crocodyli]